MLLFLYGTLRDPRVLATRAGDPSLPAKTTAAALPGWRRVSLHGSPHPTLRRARGTMVQGILVNAAAHSVERLCAYEGERYRMCRLPVRVGTKSVPARAWIAATACR